MAQPAALSAKDLVRVRTLAARLRGAGTQKPVLLTGRGAAAAAKAMGQELGQDVFRVDLSAIVSKFIGETEKNLDRVFDTAQAGGSPPLLFDEADALFGRRSEVKDAHDRFANAETAYLLQRIEKYRGLVVLVSQSQRPLPVALRRRLVVEPFPPARARIA
jgi:SpoVK/Ycf46/Vps4 family AAA+-type ATPase